MKNIPWDLLVNDVWNQSPWWQISEWVKNTHPIREKQKYAFVRVINQLMNIYYYNISNDPYPPHIVFNKESQPQIIAWDYTFSLIDLKYSQLISTIKFARSKLNKIREADPKFFEEILWLKLWKDSNGAIILAIKEMVESYAKEQNTDHQSQNRIVQSDYPVTKRLYEIMPHVSDIFTYIQSEGQDPQKVNLSANGRKYISTILSEFFVKYDQEGTLWKHRKETVFPNDKFSHLLDKIFNKEVLSEKQINEFIGYFYSEQSNADLALVIEYVIRHTNISDSLLAKNMINGDKSFIANHLYGGLYVEQDYEYNKIKQLSKAWIDRSKNQWEYADEYLIERHVKWLVSMTDKEFRSQKVNDFIRARTVVSDKILTNAQGRQGALIGIFTGELKNLTSSYNEQWWKMNISKIEVVNKYNEWDIIISSDQVQWIQASLEEIFSPQEQEGHKAVKKSQLPSIVINEDYCRSELNASNEEIIGIKEVFKKDMLKTWSNGAYADIKIKMQYTLTNYKTWEILTNTWWYEHQIIHMSSTNEAGLSSHPIILDPRKNIVNQIREKGQINIKQFQNTVHGGLQSTINQLCKWDDILQWENNWSISQQYLEFIKIQFPIRNKIPEEICKLANIDDTITYMDIGNNLQQKLAVENAIEKYLLKDLFSKGIIHPYLYISEKSQSGQNLAQKQQTQLREDKYSQVYNIDNYIDILYPASEQKNLDGSASEQKNLYRICGWWSGNLTKTVLNATLSDKWYVGISYSDDLWNPKIVYIKVGKLANILYHSLSFDEQKDSITIKDFKQELFNVIWSTK